MAQLKQTRSGWENEHLATFLLSRIAFLAHPVTVSDDLGSDLVCTLFEPRITGKGKDKHEQLFPKQAFAIQIKSSTKDLRADQNLDYLRGLEIPFFLGIVDREAMTLTIYSGELLPLIFKAERGATMMTYKPTTEPIDYTPMQPWKRRRDGRISIQMPLVTVLRVDDLPVTLVQTRQTLLEHSGMMLRNIAGSFAGQFVFEFNGPYRLTADHSSAAVYRRNLIFRLMEAIYSLRWLLRHHPQHVSTKEVLAIGTFVTEAADLGYPEAAFTVQLYQDLQWAHVRSQLLQTMLLKP